MFPSHRLDQVQASLTMAIDAKAKQYRAEGKDVLGLAAGEPDFTPPESVRRAAKEAIDAEKGRYTAVPGLPELRAAAAGHFEASTGLSVRPEEVIVTSGAKQAIFNALYVLCDPGDEVLIPSPYWTSYPEMARALGLKPVICPGDDDLAVDPRSLAQGITDRTRAIILNSPSNPTGRVVTEKRLQQIADVLRPHPIWVISDDIYGRIVYDGFRFANLPMVDPSFQDRSILVDGMSKTFCMTGWRIGFAAGPQAVIMNMSKVQSHSTSCANTIAQWAAVAALREVGDEEVHRMIEAYEARATFLCGVLDSIPGLTTPRPEAAFYAFPNVSAYFGKTLDGREVDSAMSLAEMLLDEELVAVVPGEAFGAPHHLRLSFALGMEDLRRAAERLQRFFARLR